MLVLTIDTAAATNDRLRSAGHHVIEASFGYRDGRRLCFDAPHEVDAIVFDLQTPACFDTERWGPYGGNDNYKCQIVPFNDLTWDRKRVGIGSAAVDRPRYKLIQDTQITGMSADSSLFGPAHVKTAIEKAGVPLIIFLNHQWVLRTGGVEFPNIFDARWKTSMVRSERFSVSPPLEALLPAMPAFSPKVPICCALSEGPQAQATTIVADRIGNVLGEVVTLGKGNVWLLPEMTDNAEVCVQFLAAIELGGPDASASDPIPSTGAADDGERYDVFISHATEDKESFVEPLAQLLKKRGVRVWYDRFVLRPGDSLSGKIDEGLKRSAFGILVLSKSFFAKRWPDSEYRALLALGRRLLPVWHNVEHEDVAQYSPLLLDKFAIRSNLGVESAELQITSVVRPDLMDTVTANPERGAAPARGNFEDYDLAPYRVGEEGVPVDALPWQPFAANAQPCLEAQFGEPNSIDYGETKRWVLKCSVTNVGAGAARAIRLFLPYVNVAEIDVLQPQEERDARSFIDDRFAFWNYVKFPAQTVFEYEDISGFLFRQYGSIDQEPAPSGAFYRFTLRAIGKPYRVKARIVKADFPAAWRTPIPQ